MKKLAEETGLDASHLSRVERGQRPVNPHLVAQYERIFGLKIAASAQAVPASKAADPVGHGPEASVVVPEQLGSTPTGLSGQAGGREGDLSTDELLQSARIPGTPPTPDATLPVNQPEPPVPEPPVAGPLNQLREQHGISHKIRAGTEMELQTPVTVTDQEPTLVFADRLKQMGEAEPRKRQENADGDASGALGDFQESLQSYDAVSNLRQQLDASLETAIVAESTIAHWQFVADGYGRVYRVSPPMSFLADVAPDVSELTTIVDQRLSSRQRRALCQCTAQMAGLVATTFVNLNYFREARAWFNTAKRAAEESEDATLEAWVMVRHAVSALYWNDPLGALELAIRAARMTSGVDCVATAWAPAVLARAYSRLGPDYVENVRTSITRAEKEFETLSVSQAGQHAYGYTAAQLHFYRSNALTEIGETKAAFDAQKSAIAHYGPAAFLDPSLIRLDRAVCLAKDGDSEAAANFAVKLLESLPREHVSPIIAQRARELVSAIPAGHRSLAAVRALENSLLIEVAPPALPIGIARE